MSMPTDDHDLSATHAVVTGANTGIGYQTALELARAGAHVVLACRSATKGEPAAAQIRTETGNPDVTFAALDLGDLDSVRAFATAWLHGDRPLHLLVANAGVAGQRGITASGFELHFGVNHLGHFLLTELLLPRLEASAPARIVVVASKAHYRASSVPWDHLQQTTRTYVGLDEYQVSKLCNVLYTRELARRLDAKQVAVASLHPGVVASDIWRRIPWPFDGLVKRFMITEANGARTTLHCCVSPEVVEHHGAYWDACRLKDPNPVVLDTALQDELVRRSRQWTDAARV